MPDGYTILKLGRTTADTTALESAIRSYGAPVTVLDISDQVAREVYQYDLILLRPDLHIVWRGHQVPFNLDEIAAIATGHNRQ